MEEIEEPYVVSPSLWQTICDYAPSAEHDEVFIYYTFFFFLIRLKGHHIYTRIVFYATFFILCSFFNFHIFGLHISFVYFACACVYANRILILI